jgi:rhodanese-related sulfurtransferase
MTTNALQPKPEIPSITPADLAALRAKGKSHDLIDVRTPVEFAEVHAEGATLVPLDKLDPAAVLARRGGQPDEPLYLICKSGARATRACERFLAAGFTHAVCVEGGTDAWRRCGLPVVQSANVISLERQVRIAAGTLVLLGALLGFFVHSLFYGLSAFVGAGLVFAGITNFCAMGLLLAKLPWNRRFACDSANIPS